jgi:hypothetical protein
LAFIASDGTQGLGPWLPLPKNMIMIIWWKIARTGSLCEN